MSSFQPNREIQVQTGKCEPCTKKKSRGQKFTFEEPSPKGRKYYGSEQKKLNAEQKNNREKSIKPKVDFLKRSTKLTNLQKLTKKKEKRLKSLKELLSTSHKLEGF